MVADGEVSLVRPMGALETGWSPRDIPGVGMMVDGRFHLTKPELNDLTAAAPRSGD
jgi:hypothetical protein